MGGEYEQNTLSNNQIDEIVTSLDARLDRLGDWTIIDERNEAAAIKVELMQLAKEIKRSFEMAFINQNEHSDLIKKWKEAVAKLNKWALNAVRELRPTAQA